MLKSSAYKPYILRVRITFANVQFNFLLDVQAVFVDGNYNVEEDLTGLKQFQIDICATVRDRFTTDKTNGEKIVDPVTNKTRNVASINIFNYKPYIMAALLDPRVKQTPFNGTCIKLKPYNNIRECYTRPILKFILYFSGSNGRRRFLQRQITKVRASPESSSM